MPSCYDQSLGDSYNVIYDDGQMADIVGEGKSADCYIHFTGMKRCRHAIVELKGKKISVALAQLKNSVKAIRRRGGAVDELIVVCKGISKMESRKYTIQNGKLYEKRGSKKKMFHIDGIPVQVIIRR